MTSPTPVDWRLLTDQEVVRHAVIGREAAYRELIRRYQRPVFSLVFRMVRDRELAEDLAQEVYLRLMRVDDVGLIRDPRSFALKVASNVAHEHRMLLRNRLEHSPEPLESQVAEGPGPYDQVWQSQEIKRLGEFIPGAEVSRFAA